MFTKRTLNKSLLLVLAALLVISGLGLTTNSALASACARYHTVEKGEYLSLIAWKYGTDWRTLAEMNDLKDPSLIYPGQVLCVDSDGIILPNTGKDQQEDEDVPSIDAVAAIKNEEVTIHAYNFPSNVKFAVLMGEMGSLAEDGIRVGTVTSDRDGDFEVTVDIPQALRGENQIAIRLEGVSSSWYSYNWFYNRTFETARGGPNEVELDDAESNVSVQRLYQDKAADIYQGNAGVYMPNASYSGYARVARYQSDETTEQRGLHFEQDLLEVNVYQTNGVPISKVLGLNYVYFNLSSDNRQDYDNDKLDVFYFDPGTKSWEPCNLQIFINKNMPNGRLACIAEDFGLYGLARHK